MKPGDALGVRWMLLEALPGALSAVKVAVYVVPAGIVVVPLLQTLHRNVPRVCPLTGLVAVVLVMARAGRKGIWSLGEHAAADAG